MAEFKMGVLTTKALSLISLAQAGKTNITFSKFQIGSGDWGSSPTMATLQAATALKTVKGNFPITKSEYVNPATTKLTLVASNTSNTSGGYYITEVGVFAKWTDGSDFLYAIYVTVTDKADWFPAYNSITPSSITYSVPISVANASSVTVEASAAGIATQDDMEKVQDDIADIKGYIGYNDDDIYGVEVDFVNKKNTRLAGAVGKTGGSDFDVVKAFGGRKRCNLADDGTVNAYYGDDGYIEDGTNGQVMVEQPMFYYKVVPVSIEKSGKGYITRKVRYYVSDTYHDGFKIHPAFFVNGRLCDKIYLSAFEASVYDSSESAYDLLDAVTVDFAADKLSSIAGAKPASGNKNNLTRANTRKLANNRGDGWDQSLVQTVCASELLLLIEYGSFNSQTVIGNGNVNRSWLEDGVNWGVNTGATSDLGNTSGKVTITVSGQTEGAVDQKIDTVSYRGEENLWGDLWTWFDGINIKNPSTFAAGDFTEGVYIADHSFADDSKADPYVETGLYPPYMPWSYISAFCYSKDFDWVFLPGETKGNSSVPVGDGAQNPSTSWRVAGLGGSWNTGAGAGAFFWDLDNSSGRRSRTIGGRSVYRKISTTS